jgi:hypothetical protein
LRILDSCQTKVTDLQIAILVDKDVARFEITMDDSCRVYIFETTLYTHQSHAVLASDHWKYQDLVEEVLDELFLEGS